MREHLLLKGGTAINLTVFNLPRLSVDIDLDFVPNLTREETVNERERLTEILKGFMSEQGYSLSEASRFSHSLDAFHYNYVNAAGNRDMIKIEINYSLRRAKKRPEKQELRRYIFLHVLQKKPLHFTKLWAAN